MKWKQDGSCDGKYGRTCGDYRVGKITVSGVVSYVLHAGWAQVGRYRDFAEASAAAVLHNAASRAVNNAP